MISDKGEGVLSLFLIFSNKEGGGVGQFLTLADKGGGVLVPSIFGWRHMWTAPNYIGPTKWDKICSKYSCYTYDWICPKYVLSFHGMEISLM